MRRAIGLVAVVVTMAGVAHGADPMLGPNWPPAEDCSPTRRDIDEAKATYEEGAQAYRDGDYERAARRFREAYSIACKEHALVHNLSKALERLGRWEGAAEALELFRVRGRPTGELRTQVEDHLKMLRAKAAEEHASASVPASSAGVPPTASVPPTPSSATAPSSVAPVPTPALSPPATVAKTSTPVGGWILIGAGTAVVVAGTVMAASGASQGSETRDWRARQLAEGSCEDAECAANLDRSGFRARQADGLQALGWVTLGVGCVAVATGVWWVLARRRDGVATTGLTNTPRAQLRLEFNGTGLRVTGAF